MRFERKAFAKINLDLRVLAVDADGYHELATVFQTIALHDVLRFERLSADAPFEFVCDDPSVPSDERNLVHQAAVRLWSRLGNAGPPRGARIELAKRIPAQAGLGGGSADAAVALAGLLEAWGASLPTEALVELARGLGADVPFFLTGGTALGLGRGDRLEPWPDGPDGHVVIACPPLGVSTADAYRWYDASRVPPSVRGPVPGECASWLEWLRGCRNDLEPAVVARYPLLADLNGRLRDAGAGLALMSGSGSCVFGWFDSVAAASAAAAAVETAGVRAIATQAVGRTTYRAEALGWRE